MSPIDFDVKTNLAEVMEDLQDMDGRMSDLRPVFRLFDRRVSMFARRQFETSGAVGGEPWEPLAESTKESRRSHRGGNRGGVDKPLWDFGKLKTSLQTVGPESIREIDRQRYVRGTTVFYAHFHQEGEGVPQRVIFPDPWPDQLRLSLHGLMKRHVEGRLPGGLSGGAG